MSEITLLVPCAILFSACSQAELVPAVVEDGPLVEHASYATHGSPWTLAVFDVDDDGDLDGVVGGGQLDVLLGDGAGGFTRAPGSPFAGPTQSEDFAFGDYDEDGRTDILVAEHDEAPRFFLLRGTAESFEVSPESPFQVNATPHLHTVGALDANGDGHLDVITDSWPESKLVLVLGRGDGTFETPGVQIAVPEAPIQNLRVADMNGDGRVDVVTPAHDSEAVTVMLSDGRGGFRQAPGSPFPSFGGFSTVALADLDRDGDIDVAEVHRSDQSTQYKRDALSILLGDGTGRLSHAPGSPFLELSGRAGTLAVGDVNGDGWPDVATLSELTRAITLFHGSEQGFERAGTNLPGGIPRDIAIGDLDGDGRAEVLVSDAEGARVVVLVEPPRTAR